MENNNIEASLKAMFRKRHQINPEKIVIEKNIIKLGTETIQIRNISQVSVLKPPLRISFFTILFLIIGVVLYNFNQGSGLFLIILTGSIIAYQIYKFQTGGQFLTLFQNSGVYYQIKFKDAKFLNEVRETLEDCFNNNISTATINIEHQTIGGESVTYQENHNYGGVQHVSNTDSFHSNSHNRDDHSTHTLNANGVNSSTISMGGNAINNGTQTTEINWNVLESGLLEAIKQLPEDSDAYLASCIALGEVKEKDKPKLVDTVKKYSQSFLSEVFVNAAGGVVSQMLLGLIGL